jgi:glyoxylase-like metal-dependent hydrolase (beta-lactamase superfamily II)
MNQLLKWVLGLVGVLTAVVLGLGGYVYFHAFAGNLPIPDQSQLSPNARLLQDGFVDLAMIDLGNGGVALVDAGQDKEGKAIFAELSRRKLGSDAVKAILITHGHGDHIAACDLFPKAELYALADEVGLIQGLAKPSGAITKYMPVKPTGLKVGHPLKDGDTFALGQRQVTVYQVPGHTSGSAVFLIDDVVYFGDSAGSDKAGKLKGAVDLFSDNPKLNVVSLKSLAERLKDKSGTIKTLSFAHSGPLHTLQPLLDFANWATP